MKSKLMYYLFLVCCLLFSLKGLSQQTLDWKEWDKKTDSVSKKRKMQENLDKFNDSIIISRKKYVPEWTISLKTQFPIQHALGIEYVTKRHISAYMGFGQFSKSYILTATDFLPSDDEEKASRKAFIKDKLENGFVFEVGSYYHFTKWKDFYFGVNIQFQRFTLPATPKELVEDYNFADEEELDNIQSEINANPTLRSFYENTIISPVIKPIQLGLTVGKRFSFNAIPRWSLNPEVSFHFNLTTKTTFDSDSFAGNIIINRFIEPRIGSSSSSSFSSFNFPSISLRVTYQLGMGICR